MTEFECILSDDIMCLVFMNTDSRARYSLMNINEYYTKLFHDELTRLIYQRLLDIFGDDIEIINGAILSDAFILQCLLNEYWHDNTITIYINRDSLINITNDNFSLISDTKNERVFRYRDQYIIKYVIINVKYQDLEQWIYDNSIFNVTKNCFGMIDMIPTLRCCDLKAAMNKQLIVNKFNDIYLTIRELFDYLNRGFEFIAIDYCNLSSNNSIYIHDRNNNILYHSTSSFQSYDPIKTIGIMHNINTTTAYSVTSYSSFVNFKLKQISLIYVNKNIYLLTILI